MVKLLEFKKNTVAAFVSSGISVQEASIEADILIGFVLGVKKKDIIINPDMEIPYEKLNKLETFVKKRIEERIPVQYLTNEAYFMGFKFYVDENVLIPRPETEVLVEEVIEIVKQNFNDNVKKFSILDLGTGSGCIACVLAKQLGDIKITASDISDKAINIAKTNAKSLSVAEKINFIYSDMFNVIDEKFNIIVSNPPYISINEKESLQIEVVNHEPHLALFVNDEKGLSFYEKLAFESVNYLEKDGVLAVECGIYQAELIKSIFEKNGFVDTRIVKDLSFIDRIVVGSLE